MKWDVHTDGSYSEEDGAAWAYVLECEGKLIGGGVSGKCNGNHKAAELLAISAALCRIQFLDPEAIATLHTDILTRWVRECLEVQHFERATGSKLTIEGPGKWHKACHFAANLMRVGNPGFKFDCDLEAAFIDAFKEAR